MIQKIVLDFALKYHFAHLNKDNEWTLLTELRHALCSKKWQKFSLQLQDNREQHTRGIPHRPLAQTYSQKWLYEQILYLGMDFLKNPHKFNFIALLSFFHNKDQGHCNAIPLPASSWRKKIAKIVQWLGWVPAMVAVNLPVLGHTYFSCMVATPTRLD